MMEQQKLFSIQEHCKLMEEYNFYLFSILFIVIADAICLFGHTVGL